MSNRILPPTHLAQPPEIQHAGKRFYIVDAIGQVWGSNLSWKGAHLRKEEVAGNGWSRTPTITPMPDDRGQAKQIVAAERALAAHRIAAVQVTPPTPPPTITLTSVAEAPAAMLAIPANGGVDHDDDDLDALLGEGDGLDA